MRILHVGKYYAPHKGGMETALRHMAEGLLGIGHEVRVLVAGSRRHTVYEKLGENDRGLVRAGVVATWNSQPLTLGLPGLLRHELVDFDPDIVHLHTPNPLACWAWQRARRGLAARRATLAVWHHSDIVRQRLAGRLVAPLVQRCLSDAAGICVSSEWLRDSSRQLATHRDRVHVIPFGIDTEPFVGEPQELGDRFLFVGRLVRYKGLEVLLEALAGLADARLDIVGSGPLEHSLRRRIDDLAIGGRVRLRGEIPDADLPALLAGSRALVLPSLDHSETFGMILLEALAAGVPLVVSDLPTGVRDLAQQGRTGWLVDPGHAGSLRNALAEALADPAEARRRGQAGRGMVRARYTREQMAIVLMSWYDTLVSTASIGTPYDQHRSN